MVGADDADRGQRHPPTVRETAVPELLDTPASQHLFQAVAACRKSRSGPVGRVPENRSILDVDGLAKSIQLEDTAVVVTAPGPAPPPDQHTPAGCCPAPLGQAEARQR